jgi:soluble lytic murein transglycosylase-like protein
VDEVRACESFETPARSSRAPEEPPRKQRRLLATAVAALLLAGCGGSDPGSQPDQDNRPTASAEDGKRDRRAAEPTASAEPADPLPSAPPLEERFVPARSARELASRLVASEQLARGRGTAEDVRSAAAFESQLLYRQLARKPGWQQAVRAAAPRRYRADVGAHVHARRSLRSLHTDLSDELPAWRIVEPAPTADLLRFYREGERTFGVPWEVLAAINLVETGFGRIDGLSTAGAQGPMQFIPSTWAAYGKGDINDPHDAILGAARYLAANGGDSRSGIENALYRYNNHAGYVAGILAYASVLERDPRAIHGLVRWEIIYLSTIGDLWLPVGYRETKSVPARRYVREHPERHLGTSTT